MNATDEFDAMLLALDRDLNRTLPALSPAQRRRALAIARGHAERDATGNR